MILNFSNQRIKINYILNSPILTDWGMYKFTPYLDEIIRLDLSEAISAVGHDSTAKLLSQILCIPIATNRVKINMKIGETALVFILRERIPEGKVLSFQELQNFKYDLGLLKRIK